MDKILTNLKFFDFIRSKKMRNSIEAYNYDQNNQQNMLKTANNLRYSFICDPLAIFLQIQLTLRPAQQFELDMPDLNGPLIQ
jgi:hypothetical protein